MDVIVLAGTSKPSKLTENEGVKNKAFVSIHKHVMLNYVITALEKVSEIEKIVVVGPYDDIKKHLTLSDTLLAVDEGDTLVDNLKFGLKALSSPKNCLIVASDSAFLTKQSISNFIKAAYPFDKAIYYPIISQEDTENKFPGVKRTYAKLSEGEFTGGNVFLVDTTQMKLVLPKLNHFFELRKSPLRLAGALGADFILKFLTKKLTIKEVEERFESLFSVSAKAIISKDAELGTDVDKPEDLELARNTLIPL